YDDSNPIKQIMFLKAQGKRRKRRPRTGWNNKEKCSGSSGVNR
ncbi:hypothetical protein TNCT_7701, partial [Trichonephila clavata]